MLTQFHENAQKAIVIAESIAFDLGHSSVGSEHLLLSLLKMKNSTFSNLLKKNNVTDSMIYDDIKRLFGEKDVQPFYMEYSEIVKKILDDAIHITQIQKEEKVSLNILCIALLNQTESVAVELLNKYHIHIDEIKKELSEEKTLLHELDSIHELTNYNQLVRNENRKMIGREKELEQLFLTLCKKEKNNALLIGKAGVGKTALVEKLADKINCKEVPKSLENKIIYELNLSSIVAGTKYRGEFEEKFKKIIDKVMQAKEAILFIDEIHNLIGAGGAEGAIDASNILKPYLARKDLTIIGATTIEEYYKYFEKDQAMNRRFAIIKINENTKEETKTILLQLKKQYEEYHHLHIPSESVDSIIQLCDQYMIQRVFPDKALDVLDLACVKASFMNEKTLQNKQIELVIEEMTGMKISQDTHFQNLQAQLEKRIIGQSSAIQTLSQSMRALTQYPHSQKPIGIYLFIGPSGVGKTQTVKELATITKRHLIQLDMSEYSEATSISKIIGSSPGYVGYDEQSFLQKELALYPNSILLLDEIEKAHPQVLHLFLQVFDEGILKDSHHHQIQFRDTFIFMTSNVYTQTQKKVGFKKQNISSESLKEYFSEAFINRIDEIIPYSSLTKKDLKKIVKQKMPMTVHDEIIDSVLTNYDNEKGARNLLTQMKKYLINEKIYSE